MMLKYDLIDIWRIRNPDKLSFTWRQKKPFIQRRLDYWLIENSFQEDVQKVEIIPSIKSDHSAIVLKLNSVPEYKHGPSYWKLNSSLLEDPEYVTVINNGYQAWRDEFKEVEDKRVLWDLIKYKIRQTTIKWRSKTRRSKLNNAEQKLKDAENKCSLDPSERNIIDLEVAKTEYESYYDYVVHGSIIRSRAEWYEKGEKNNKYFLGLERSRNRKNCVRKIYDRENRKISDPKIIIDELEYFYSQLYTENPLNPVNGKKNNSNFDSFFSNLDLPQLSNEQKANSSLKLV